MNKNIFCLLLAGSLILTGCGDSHTDFTQVSGQQGNPAPIVTPTPTSAYFVDAVNGNDATAAANPTSNTPFATIQAAVVEAPEGTTITVRPGNYSGAVNLKDDQRLLGVAGGNRPILTGPVDLADGNTLDFLRIANSPDDGIIGDNQNGGTITNCEIINSAGDGIQLEPAIGSWEIAGNVIQGSGSFGIIPDSGGTGSVRYRINNNTITGSTLGAIGLVAGNDSQLVAQIHNNTMTGNQTGATFEAIAGSNATLSLDIEDNTNDDVYRFGSIDASTINVEQFAQLETINSSGTVSVSLVSNPIVDVANGFCGF